MYYIIIIIMFYVYYGKQPLILLLHRPKFRIYINNITLFCHE